MSLRETPLVRAMIRFARSQGCLALKRHGSLYSVSGEPDLLVLVPVPYQSFPVPVFCEVKVPGKTPSPLQLRALKALERVGAVAVWIDTLTAFRDVIRQVKEGKCDVFRPEENSRDRQKN